MTRSLRFASLALVALPLSLLALPRLARAAEVEEEEPDADRPAKQPDLGAAGRRVDERALRALDPEMRDLAAEVAAGTTDPRILRAYDRMWDQLFPFDFVPPRDLRERALRAKQALEARAAAGLVPMPTGCWSELGPVNIPGRMTALAGHPTDPNVVFAGGADGGIWKTSNLGLTWSPLTDTLSSLAIGAIALDPADPNTIYAGLGEGNYSGDALAGPGLLKSVDGGGTWTTYPFPAGYFHEIQVDPHDRNRVWAATRSGLFVSTDAGQTWSQAGGGLPVEDVTTFVASAKPGSSVLLAGVGSGRVNSVNSGLWRSGDGGASWAPVVGPQAGGDTGRSSMAQSRSNPDRLYIAFHDRLVGTIGSIWRSDDEGATWTQVGQPNTVCGAGGTPPRGGQCWYNFHLAIDAVNPDLLYLGLVSAYRSADAGATWTRISVGIHVDQHFIHSPAPDVMLIANDGGLYRTPNRGGTWENTGRRLVTGQYYHITSHPVDDAFSVGGTQDNGTHRYRGTASFDQVIGADGAWTAIDWVDPRVWYGSTQYLGMARSRDNGDGFVAIGNGIPPNQPPPAGEYRAFIAPFALDRGNPSTVFAGTTKLYRSTDQGDNFAAISPDLPATVGAGSYIRSMDNCRDVPASIWIGTSDGKVWNTPDGGSNWIDATGNLPLRSMTSLAVHPSQPGTAYVTLGGTGTGHVWKTVDSGVTWTDLSAGLPDIIHRHILMIPEQPQTLFVAADLGIYRSDDGGQTWSAYGTGLPNVAVDWIGYNPTTGTVRVGTHGRGMWQLVPVATCPRTPDFAGLSSVTQVSIGGQCAPQLSWLQATSTCPLAPGVRYNVYRSTDPLFVPGAGSLLATGVVGTTYRDLTAATLTPYYYAVKAEDGQTGYGGPANGGREDFNAAIVPFELGDPFAGGSFRDDGGDSKAWMKSGYWTVDNFGNSTAGGRYSYHSAHRGSAYNTLVCGAIETPDMVLGAAATLTYQASYNLEYQYDGVAVEISTDGGATWNDLPPNGGYNGDISQTGANGCGFAATRAVFNGPSNNAGLTPFQPFTTDLAAFAGQTVRFRWLLSADGGVEFEGFLLDDVMIGPATAASTGCACTGPVGTVVPNRLLVAHRGFGAGTRFVWSSVDPTGSWNLHCTTSAAAIPTLASDFASIVAPALSVRTALDNGSFPAGYYQVYGADCAGTSVP